MMILMPFMINWTKTCETIRLVKSSCSHSLTRTWGVKRRPALVLLDAGGGDIVVARVTSQQVQTGYDVRLIEWKRAGLLLPSVVRLHKLATLQKTLAERRLGALTTKDSSRVKAKIQPIWASV